MSLETSYEVLDLLRDDGVQTFRAKEKATGRGLELHLFLPFGRPENKALFDRLKALPLETRRKFLDVGVDGSTPYVVTDPLPGNRGFKGWADELLAETQGAPSGFTTGIFGSAPSREDGVQILQAGQWRTGTPIPDSLVSRPPSLPLARPPQPPTGDTGDFTRMFKAPDFLSAPQPPTPPVSSVAAPPPGEFTGFFQAPEPAKAPLPHITQDVNSTTGEFTGLFEAKKPTAPTTPPPVFSAPPPPVPNSAPEPAAGEFTRMFQAPSAASLQPQQSAPPPPKPQPEPSGGVEFTKYFENPLRPAAMGSQQPTFELPPPPPPPTSKRGGDFTDVFGRPSTAPSPGSQGGYSLDSPAPPPPSPVFGASAPTATGAFSAQPAWSQPQAQQTFPTGPSEYTKMINAVPNSMGAGPSVFNAAPNNAAPNNAAPPVQMVAKKSNMPIFIAIGVVVLLVIGIAVFLLMQHSGATTPAAK
jgi:hypothetical protein